MSYQHNNRNTQYQSCHYRVPPLYQTPQDNQNYCNQNSQFYQTTYHHHIPQYKKDYRHTRTRTQNQSQIQYQPNFYLQNTQYTPNRYYRDMQHKKQNYHRFNQNQHIPNKHTQNRYQDSFNSDIYIDMEHQVQETDQQQMYSIKQIQQYLANQKYQNQWRNTNSYTHTLYNQQTNIYNNYTQQDENICSEQSQPKDETELDEEFYKKIRVNMVFPRFNEEPTPQNPPDKPHHPENYNGSNQL